MEEVNNTQDGMPVAGDAPAAAPVAETVAPPEPAAAPPSPEAPQESAPASDVQYAGFFARFIALLIDMILLGIVLTPLGLAGAVDGGYEFNAPGTLVMMAYLVIMDVKFGGTLGKKALKLRVQDMESSENLDVLNAILRETVGRFLSAIVFALGYFWMLWDKNKQTWHDKIGKSVVVKDA